ncbi:MAG: SRPBCC family protein [Allobranchiibius sp.]
MNRWATTTAVAAGTGLAVRRWYLRWGATDDEVHTTLPGDQLMSDADLTATRAITIRANSAQVWPWLAQLGQGRGGFYSYDRLENLAGCDIRSADRIIAQWQSVEVGDDVHPHPDMGLVVAQVEPGRALVLSGGVPVGSAPAPYAFTWAFVLREGPDGTTRLVVRERYRYTRWWTALLVEPVEAVSAVMSQRMLRGIRERAESATAVQVTPSTSAVRAT